MHSGKKWRSALWLHAMHSGDKFEKSYPFLYVLLNPYYVGARALRSLHSLCSNHLLLSCIVIRNHSSVPKLETKISAITEEEKERKFSVRFTPITKKVKLSL